MSSRSETSASALERLHTEVEGVARMLSARRTALPALAMGTDSEALVHVGIDDRGDVVRLDLDASWRDTLPTDGLGPAVSEALQQASQVRTGDWAAAVASSYPRPRSTVRTPVASVAAAPRRTGPVTLGRGAHGTYVSLVPGWTSGADDASIRQALLSALTLSPEPAPVTGARPAEVRDLLGRARQLLLSTTDDLPTFMRAPIYDSIERVHDGVLETLALPVASEGLVSGELGSYAAGLHDCLRLVDRPAGLPEATYAWAAAAAALTSGLAAVRKAPRPILSRLRRRASA